MNDKVSWIGHGCIAILSCLHLMWPISAHAQSLPLPLGLPTPLPVPNTNPLTPEKIDLGRRLFFDRRLSPNNTISCAMCHVPAQGFTVNETRLAVGIHGKTGKRNTPSLYNVAYQELLFHDGREFTLEDQIIAPLTQPDEMGNPSIGYVVNKIKKLPGYKAAFHTAFGEAPSVATLGKALRKLGYEFTRQRGSHMRYTTEQNGNTTETNGAVMRLAKR